MKRLPNIHPGKVLRAEFLVPLQISQYRLAKEIAVTEARISRRLLGQTCHHRRHGLAPGGILRHHARFLAGPTS